MDVNDLAGFYACAIPTSPEHLWNVFISLVSVLFFYAVLCRGNKCVGVHEQKWIWPWSSIRQPSAALCEPQHITSFQRVWFMQGAQMVSV